MRGAPGGGAEVLNPAVWRRGAHIIPNSLQKESRSYDVQRPHLDDPDVRLTPCQRLPNDEEMALAASRDYCKATVGVVLVVGVMAFAAAYLVSLARGHNLGLYNVLGPDGNTRRPIPDMKRDGVIFSSNGDTALQSRISVCYRTKQFSVWVRWSNRGIQKLRTEF